MYFYVFDTDGNTFGDSQVNAEDAIVQAALAAIDLPNWDRFLVAQEVNPEGKPERIDVAHVERCGPKGSRTVRISHALCGWLSVERSF